MFSSDIFGEQRITSAEMTLMAKEAEMDLIRVSRGFYVDITNSFRVYVGLKRPMDSTAVTQFVVVTTTPMPSFNPGSVPIRLTGLDTCHDVMKFDSNGIQYILHHDRVFSSDIFGKQHITSAEGPSRHQWTAFEYI